MILWTADAIVSALHAWAEKHGSPPTANDWRMAGYDHPCVTTVVRRFGSWNEGLARAGFETQRGWLIGAAA